MAETKINANQTNITASDIGAASTAQLAGKQDIMQYETLPTASADNVDSIVQFVGATDSTYTNGYFYKCTESSGSYSWVQTDVQPSPVIPDPLPSQTGQSGKYLTTNGSSASWGTINALSNMTTALNSIAIKTTSGQQSAGTDSVCIGNSITSYDNNHVVIGSNAYVNWDNSIAIGYGARADGRNALAIGNSSQAATYSNYYTSIAIGSSATAATTSAAIGQYCSSGNYCATIGVGITNNAYGSICIGCNYNGKTNSETGVFKVYLSPSLNYDPVEYKLLDSDGTIPTDRFTTTPSADGTYIPSVTVSDGVATRTWDSKEFIAHMAMPSANYDELTFGASGTIYTAPADGWFIIHMENSGLTNHWVNLTLNGVFIGNYWAQVANNSFGIPPIPCAKGGTLKVDYGSDIKSSSKIRFFYANGAQ